jgi:hypothetical protein
MNMSTSVGSVVNRDRLVLKQGFRCIKTNEKKNCYTKIIYVSHMKKKICQALNEKKHTGNRPNDPSLLVSKPATKLIILFDQTQHRVASCGTSSAFVSKEST